MAGVQDLQKAARSISNLGSRRLMALGIVGAVIIIAICAIGYVVSRPQFEILYSGLDAQDVARVSSALRDANMTFDVSADGGTVLIEYGQTARARMLLAESGLPHNASQGYELFDKMGSLGLTSFMQEVTRVRALEGELARSIQAMQGVRAARVHLVLPEEGTFRKNKQGASASVVVRFNAANDVSVAQAIRHLVAAAVPGMTIDMVTVLNTDGAILASGADGESSMPTKAVSLEHTISESLQDNVRRTLTPMVGLRNLNVSVAVRLNTDKKQINETIFNPDSRVERSVRVIRENQTAQNSTGGAASSVEKNIPGDKGKDGSGKQSAEENQKREELTNFEVSSKSISTTSGAYSIEKLSVAILVNKAGIVASLGENPTQEAIDKRINEISELAASAAGLDKERGDTVKVATANFADAQDDLAPAVGPGFFQQLTRHLGTFVNAAALIGGLVVLGIFVVKPAVQVIAEATPPPALPSPNELESASAPFIADDAFNPAALANPSQQAKQNPYTQKLEDHIAVDESQAAAVLKNWIRVGA